MRPALLLALAVSASSLTSRPSTIRSVLPAVRSPAVELKVFPPDNHHREAGRIIGNLKGNAALLAAFSFSALNVKEPLAGAGLQSAYVVFACLTLALELTAVFVGQQLLYRMADGSFGTVDEDGYLDPDRTILSVLLSNYRFEFQVVRTSFLAGIVTMMATITVRAWATYEPPLAATVTSIFLAAGGVMAASNRESIFEFERVRLLDSRTSSIRQSFDEADVNADGRICAAECSKALGRCGIYVEDVEDLIAKCDGCTETMSLDFDGFSTLVRMLRDECYVPRAK
mmetsp:Transcript_44725/g.117280  ORF Transcript_44725/g.117280 Transcript_44725/m.117280 type:complete len:285 (-) Transcript_44725:140-994(-)